MAYKLPCFFSLSYTNLFRAELAAKRYPLALMQSFLVTSVGGKLMKTETANAFELSVRQNERLVSSYTAEGIALSIAD